MTRSALVYALAVALLVVPTAPTLAQDAPVGVQDLASATGEEALEVARQIIAQREAMIAGLVEQMNEQEDWDRDWGGARYATFLLGYMRAIEAAPVVTRFVDFGHRPPYGVFGRGPAWQGNLFQMPSVWALVQIGEPCLNDVVERIAVGSGGEAGQAVSYCVRVLVELRGVEGAAATLVSATAGEADEERRAHLTNAVNVLLEHGADYARAREDPNSRQDPLARVP